MDGIPEELMNELSWREESLHVLCWAGGLKDGLAWPVKNINLVDVFPLIPPEVKTSRVTDWDDISLDT